MYFIDPGNRLERPHYFAKATTTDHSHYFQFCCCHSDTPYTIALATTLMLSMDAMLQQGLSEDVAVFFKFYSPSNSPTALNSSTRSQTTLITIRMGTPRNKPHMPHSQPQASTPANTATGFMRLARLASQG